MSSYSNPNRGDTTVTIAGVNFQGNQIENVSWSSDGEEVQIDHFANAPDGETIVTTVKNGLEISGFHYPYQLLPDVGGATVAVVVTNPAGLTITASGKIKSKKFDLAVKSVGKFSVSLSLWDITVSAGTGVYYS